jgi:archaemetzincin
MNIKKLIIFILGLVCVFSCNDKDTINSESSEQIDPIVINIQPFDGIPQNQLTYVYNELHKIYPNILINKSISLPRKAFYASRNRYRADSLIKYLRTITPNGHVTIGMTDKDISHTKGNIQDYGIMGLGYQPGKSCVVSTFRLSKENLLEQYFKLSIHELGHTQGLPHCPVKSCFMRDAKGKNHTDEETDFCPKCKTHLISKGWTFKN